MSRRSPVSAVLEQLGIAQSHPARRQVNAWFQSRRAVRDALEFVPTESYSQCAEDAIIQTLIDPTPGGYIDIGSGHPVRGSNTYALYKKGWSGLLVDPLRSNIELSRRIRPRDVCVESLCSSVDLPAVQFFEYEIYEYSTASPERVEELRCLNHEPHCSYELRSLSLATLVREHDLRDARLLSVDVEGLDIEVLQGNDWDSFRPELIIVEEWDPPLSRSTPVSQLLGRFDYRLVSFNRVSSFYLATS